jgi:signal transduction histidine kinase/CheY-like chemotaxis protein
MDKLDLRHKLLYQDVLPVLPPVARAVLAPTEKCTPDALAAFVGRDDALRRSLTEAAFPDGSAPRDVDPVDLICAFPLGHLRAHIFRHVLESMLDRRFPLERDMLERAGTRSRIALAIADHLETPMLREHAGLAAIVLDLGVVALDRALDGRYSEEIQVAHARGARVLEAEQQALGVDQTLAGKWAATRWSLPDPIIDLLWFRHHSPHLLDLIQEQPELTHLVVVADLLAGDNDVWDASDVSDRLERLGLEVSEVKALLAEDPAPAEASQSVPEVVSVGDASREAALIEEVARLRAALTHAEQRVVGLQNLVFAQDLCEVIKTLVEALHATAGLDAAGAMVVPGDEEGVGYFFSNDVQGVHALAAAGSPDAAADELRERLDTGGACTWLEAPLRAGGRVVGAVIVRLVEGDAAFSMAGVQPLLAAVEAALERCLGRRREAVRAEHMATALWKQELGSGKFSRGDHLRRLAEVARGAAHEINNPLAIVSGRAQMLLSHANGPGDVKALETIVQQSRRASAVISELMQFAQPQQPYTRECSINFLLHQAVAGMRKALAGSGIEVEESYAADLPKVSVDRAQMGNVFEHLLRNAEAAMTPEGGTLSVKVKASTDHKSVVIQVADTGRGIPAEHLHRVFEPFYKVTENPADGGTGLGLSVCHGIVELHRGTISLQSREGEGCTCTITLPALANTQADPLASAPGEPDEERVAARPRGVSSPPAVAPIVMVAEADDALRSVLKEALSGQGYTVACYRDGLEALAGMLTHPPALIICHHPLWTTGQESLLDQVRARHAHLPIIALGAKEDDTAVSESGGETYYLPKPFSLEALLQTVRRLLPGKALAAGA